MIFIFFLWFLIISLAFLLIKQLKIKKNILICILISILIVLFILNINAGISAALDGAKLWYKAILPTTFPFVVICNLLIYYDGISLYSKFLGPLLCKPLGLSKNCSFPLVASILCGYPLGAKYCVDLYSMKYIGKEEFIRVLNIASTVGPLFLIGSVGVSMLGNSSLGYILLIGNYLSAVCIGIITQKKRTSQYESSLYPSSQKISDFGTAIKNAVENGINTVLAIGGFIIIFSVIISLAKNSSYITFSLNKLENIFNLPTGTLYGLFLGSIEITNGCNILSSIKLYLPIKLGIISFLCSFSGLAIIAQVSSFVSSTKIKYSKYIILKVIQGLISFIITYFAVKILPTSITTSSIKSDFTFNTYMYSIPILILLVLFLMFKFFNKLFLHTS